MNTGEANPSCCRQSQGPVPIGKLHLTQRAEQLGQHGVDRTVGAGALPAAETRVRREALDVAGAGVIVTDDRGGTTTDDVRSEPGEVLYHPVERGADVASRPIRIRWRHRERQRRVPGRHPRLVGNERLNSGSELIEPPLRQADHQDLRAVGGHRPRR